MQSARNQKQVKRQHIWGKCQAVLMETSAASLCAAALL